MKSFLINPKAEFSTQELSFWKQFGIGKETLIKYEVLSLQSYTEISNSSTPTNNSCENNPIFSYCIAKDLCYKIYQPMTGNKKVKFMFVGSKPVNYFFGYKQLPETGNCLYIAAGEKDVLTLASNGYLAITLNSESANLPEKLLNELQDRFNQIVIIYDIDETGSRESRKLCEKHGLSRVVIPNQIVKNGGKDISDWVKLGYKIEDALEHLESFDKKKEWSKNLDIVLKSEQTLRNNKSKDIIFSEPILSRYGDPFIYPRTINVIQGKSGTHKSRLAELICSCLLKKNSYNADFLGLEQQNTQSNTVFYVDTERNVSDQLPYSLQQIQLNAGYSIIENPSHFSFISLIEIKRDVRFNTLREYLDYISDKVSNHVFIVLDVVTDCLKDFNRSEDSMKLIDLMNETINQYNVTFLCLIHENPGGLDKARGHLGTEIMNKASTVIQINFEPGKNNELTDLIKIKYLKCRNTKRPDPFHLIFDEDTKRLIEAPEEYINEIVQSRNEIAPIEDIVSYLSININGPISKSELITGIISQFGGTSRTIDKRLKIIIDKEVEIIYNNIPHKLKKSKNGAQVIYSLEPIFQIQ